MLVHSDSYAAYVRPQTPTGSITHVLVLAAYCGSALTVGGIGGRRSYINLQSFLDNSHEFSNEDDCVHRMIVITYVYRPLMATTTNTSKIKKGVRMNPKTGDAVKRPFEFPCKTKPCNDDKGNLDHTRPPWIVNLLESQRSEARFV